MYEVDGISCMHVPDQQHQQTPAMHTCKEQTTHVAIYIYNVMCINHKQEQKSDTYTMHAYLNICSAECTVPLIIDCMHVHGQPACIVMHSLTYACFDLLIM